MSQRGATNVLVPAVLTVVAMGVALFQTTDGQGEIHVPRLLYDAGQWVVVALVAVVAWILKRFYAEHERRLGLLEKTQREGERMRSEDFRRFDDLLHRLDVAVAELKAVCPFCRDVKGGAAESRRPFRERDRRQLGGSGT